MPLLKSLTNFPWLSASIIWIFPVAAVVVLVVVACKSSVRGLLFGLLLVNFSPNTGDGGGVMFNLRQESDIVL